MTISERIGRNMAQGAMNQISEAFEPPWWLGLAVGLGAYVWALVSGSKKEGAKDLYDVEYYIF